MIKLNFSRGRRKLQSKKRAIKRGYILLVDDEPENLDGLVALLEGEGYVVTATTSPHEALKIFQSQKIDLIISDQRMPLMLGTELLTAVKAHSEDNIRVILTGHTDMNDLITCINNGLLYRYLVKPWHAEVVLEVVEEGMKKIRIERATQRLVPNELWERLYSGRFEDTTFGEGCHLECVAALIGIRDFQSSVISEDPSKIFRLLSEVVSTFEPHIKRHHGYVSQRAGDGVLVIFDREGECTRDALNCALEFNTITQKLNEKLSAPNSTTQGHTVKLGVGMHTGKLLLGTVGSSEHLEFRTLGEVIGIAARIESFTRRFDDQSAACITLLTLAISEHTKSPLHSLGEHQLLALEEPLELFKL